MTKDQLQTAADTARLHADTLDMLALQLDDLAVGPWLTVEDARDALDAARTMLLQRAAEYERQAEAG